MYRLMLGTLRNWDEAWYAEIVKQMAVGGKGWLMPWWNGQYYFDHPPLYFWLSGLVVKLFGLGEWQLRLVAQTAMVGVGIMTYLLAKRWFGHRVGLISVGVLVTLGQVMVRLSHGNLEALVMLGVLVTLYSYVYGKWWVAGITLGLGFLTKGWLLGLLPVVILGLWDRKVSKKLIGVMAIGVVIFGLWFIAGASQFGRPFVERYLWQPGAGRLGTPLENFSVKQFYHVARDLGWWLVPLMMLAVGWSKHKKKLGVLGLTTLGYILALSFLNEKSDWYTLPVYPLVAMMVAVGAKHWKSVVIAGLLVGGGVNAYRIENLYPDRSGVGASLGQYAKTVIPKGETVIWDDHDFTAFLFYSDVGMVYVPEPAGPKPGEWWVIKYEDIPELVGKKGQAWLVTPRTQNEWPGIKSTTVSEYQGYQFVKLTFD